MLLPSWYFPFFYSSFSITQHNQMASFGEIAAKAADETAPAADAVPAAEQTVEEEVSIEQTEHPRITNFGRLGFG